MNLSSPPKNDEVEISLFGAGFGECLVIHTGSGEWHVIDSCRFKGAEKPAALNYLEQIGVDYETNVKTIVATHWDDDHIRGIGDVVEKCSNAQFIMSLALYDTKFFKLAADPDSPLFKLYTLGQKASTGLNEFIKILHFLRDNNKKIKYAGQDKCVWKSLAQENTKLIALSPHDQVFEHVIRSIVSQIPVDNKPVVNIKALKPNFTSVVLWLCVGDDRFLLGADLEEDPIHKSWTVISENNISIDRKARIYKVAHHGSSTGEHEGIWSNLLEDGPICLIAPWMLGGHVLPSGNDLERISQKSDEIYVSRDQTISRKLKPEEKHVKRFMEQIKAKSLLNDFSMVRLRKSKLDDVWNIECFGSAFKHEIESRVS